MPRTDSKRTKSKSKAKSKAKTKLASKATTKKKAAKSKSSLKRTTKKKGSAVKGGKPRKSSPKSKKTRSTSAPAVRIAPSKVTSKLLLQAFREMVRARLIDEKTIVLYKQNKCFFQIGVAGHEAVQIAAGLVFRAGVDWFYPYYRDMAIVAALGMTNEEFMLNAMNKEDDPNSHGRQMPMHYGDREKHIVSQSSPTGTQYNQAVGCALGAARAGTDEVVYVSSGEGACAQGDFHEALNWAARDRLPVVFLIQNNQFAISVPVSEQLAGESVYRIAAGYEHLDRIAVDGTDFKASYLALKKAHERARKGKGPTVIEAAVPRLQSHSISDNHLKYREQKAIDAEQSRCPIAKLRAQLIRQRIATKAQLEAIEADIKSDIDRAAEWAEAQPDTNPEHALDYTWSEPHPQTAVQEAEPTGPEIYMVDALNHALDEELAYNPDLFIFGQDVAHGKGGVFSVTAGLTEKYGNDRVFNAQLAESSIAGVAIGMATRGLKPVAEIQFGDYVWTAMMQIRNELAMLHYRSRGDFSCPAIIRIPVGGYIRGACYHSQNIEGTFTHFPGLFVIYPSNATDAKGLLKTACRSHNPVLFLEHKGLYRQVYAKGPEGDDSSFVPIGKSKTVCSGTDLTIISWGMLVHKSIQAARELEKDGVSVEVIDLRTLVPLDRDAIFASVQKTNRVLIAHEDTTFMGFGAEIAAQIASDCFEHLDAPVRRVGMRPAAAVPHAPALEEVVLPQVEDVLEACRDLLMY